MFGWLVLITIAGALLAALAPVRSVAAGLGVFVFILAGWLVSVCLHEFAHAYLAFKAGDSSVVDNDYLRLNPFRYVHPLLSIGLPLIWIAFGGIGLPGGAVQVHHHRFRSRGWASAVSAAGPLVNLVLAIIAIESLRLFPHGHGTEPFAAISWFAWLQLSVVILNLIPIPGLDGWGILEPWMAPETVHAAQKIKPFGILIIVVLLLIPSIDTGFSNLVDHFSQGLGNSEVGTWLGSVLFKFWRA